MWDEGTSTVIGSSEAVPADAKLFSGAFEFAYDENMPETVWYVVADSMTVNTRLEGLRHKTVNLVLRDGVTLTCSKGIRVARRDGDVDPTYVSTLNIYGESEPYFPRQSHVRRGSSGTTVMSAVSLTMLQIGQPYEPSS